MNHIGRVMVSTLTSSVVDSIFEPLSGQTKDYKIGICCFSFKYPALRRKSKYWLARNQDNVSEWGNMSIRGLFFQWASTIKKIPTKRVGLVQSHRPEYSWKIARWTLNNNQSIKSSTKWTSSSFHWKLICSLYDKSWKIAELPLNNNHPIIYFRPMIYLMVS